VSDLSALTAEQYCYLTTTGRNSGLPHEIEIWYGINKSTVYMLSGGRQRSDWVKNIAQIPAVTLRITTRQFTGSARIVHDPDEDALARRILLEKYAPTYAGDLTSWGHTALPVAVDID
jgi:deazaflavin-dependent oxidoreductase (nitroreductase family)